MKMICGSCKREIDVSGANDSCPFCGGTIHYTYDGYSTDEDDASIKSDLEWIKHSFEDEHFRKEKRIIVTALGLAAVLLIMCVSMVSGIKKAALIKKYGGEIVKAIEIGDFETAKNGIDDLSSVGRDKNTLLAVADYNNQMVEHCLRQTEKYASKGDYEAAIQYIKTFNEITGLSGANGRLKEYYKHQALQELERYLAREDYEGACNYLQNIIAECDLDDPEIIGALASCKQKQKTSLVAMAQELTLTNDYDGAITILNRIQDPDADVKSLIYSNKKADIEQRLASFESSGDYAAAVVFLKNEMDRYKELSDEYATEYESYADEFRTALFTQADAAYKSGTYKDAVTMLQDQGYPVLGKSDSKLNEQIDYYNGLIPISITELNPYKGHSLENYSLTDVYGDVYPKAVRDNWDDTTIKNSYRISGKYSTLAFKLIVDENFKNMPNDTGVHIYGDGKELFYYVTDDEDREPVDVIATIEGVQNLEIVLDRERNWGRHMVATDMVLYP